MLRIGQHPVDLTVFDDLASSHHGHRIRDVPRQSEVVGDDECAHAEVLLQCEEQRQDLSAHRGVQGRDGLIGDEHLRVESQGAGDDDALPLSARELLRNRFEVVLGRGQLGCFERTDDPLVFAVFDPLHFQAFDHGFVHAALRIERPGRILQNHLHLPPERPQLLGLPRQRLAGERQLRTRFHLLQTEQRACQSRLPRSGLADDGEDLRLPQLQIHPAHRAFAAPPGIEGDTEVLRLEHHLIRHGEWFGQGHLGGFERPGIQPGFGVPDLRKRTGELLRVVLLRGQAHRVAGPVFDEAAVAHDREVRADGGEHGEVVADHQQGDPAFGDEAGQAGEDLLLHDDVEGRGRLVGDDDVGFAGERHGDHDPLLLPAGELVRIRIRLRRFEVDFSEEFEHPVAALLRSRPRVLRMVFEGFDDLTPDLADGIERVQGTLEDDRGLRPSDGTDLTEVQLPDVLTAEEDPTVEARRLRQQAQSRHDQRRLPRAGLPRNAQGGTGRQIEADVLDGDDVTAVGGGSVGDRDVLELQIGHQRLLRAGLMMASKARPTIVNASTTSRIAMPGVSTYHQ